MNPPTYFSPVSPLQGKILDEFIWTQSTNAKQILDVFNMLIVDCI